ACRRRRAFIATSGKSSRAGESPLRARGRLIACRPCYAANVDHAAIDHGFRCAIFATIGARKCFMSNVQKVSVALTPEFMALLKEAVDTGEYTSASEVIRDALRYWKQRRTIQHLGVDELRQLWDEGIASGPGRLKSIQAIKKEARRRSAYSGKTSA
ncbi:MAG: type II toxin-antitoxin system ParD family antitoxin, partial [Rhodoplanes sp.]